MNIPLILAVIVTLFLLLELVFLLIRGLKNRNQKKKYTSNDSNNETTCSEVENCWCCEYELPEDKKEAVLKNLGNQYCGKTVRSIVNNEYVPDE